MIRKIKNWFTKNTEDVDIIVHEQENTDAKFILKVDNINMGILSYENGYWHFLYTEEFKENLDHYNLIVGFPDINKEYKSEALWPFFLIQIPGLKQPAIKEIIEKEHINESNEVELLKRFGKKSISNPYELIFS
jgi:HipA-like protein